VDGGVQTIEATSYGRDERHTADCQSLFRRYASCNSTRPCPSQTEGTWIPRRRNVLSGSCLDYYCRPPEQRRASRLRHSRYSQGLLQSGDQVTGIILVPGLKIFLWEPRFRASVGTHCLGTFVQFLAEYCRQTFAYSCNVTSTFTRPRARDKEKAVAAPPPCAHALNGNLLQYLVISLKPLGNFSAWIRPFSS